MDLSPSPGEDAIRQRFAELFARESTPARVRAAEPLGFDADLWSRVLAAGALDTALHDPERGRLALALAAESAGRHLAPVPLVEGVVAARALARAGGEGACSWLPAAREGTAVPALALFPAEGGIARFVPAGAVAHAVLALDGDALVVAGRDPRAERLAPANLGSVPLSHFPLTAQRQVLAEGAHARRLHDRALDEWRALAAAALVGLAGGALALAVAHVRRREQFGVSIGSFQALQHRLADLATDVDGARLLAWEAAWAGDAGQDDAARLAAMAWLWAARVAERCAAESLHLHGGYGFTLERDPQLYFRRAKAWALLLGDPRRELRRLADRLFGPAEDAACTSD